MVDGKFRNAGELVVRHRFIIWDLAVIGLAAALLVFFWLEYEFFLESGLRRSVVASIALGEALFIVAVLGLLLFVAIKRMKLQLREVERRLAAELHVRELAYLDALTGLPNRRRFDQAVGEAVGSPPGAGRAHAVLLVDLNGFKLINDAFGHPVGDAVLREIGIRLLAVTRDTGHQVARIGGDEFGIVATHVRGAEDASRVGLRVIDALSAPIRIDRVDHSVGVGIGIALFPRDGRTSAEVVRRADIALYRAKSEPESGLHFFEEAMDERVRERAVIERELRRALAEGQVQPYYQPIVALGSGKITGIEALARWHHHTLGDVPAARFIPVAEDCGLIADLGKHILRTACRDARAWPEQTLLSVNVSPLQLRDPAFGLAVLAILGETGLPPQRLELEITENMLVRDLKSAQDVLGGLRDAGVRIALDDFGTGYSSLYHLRNFKIDRIKIDRAFIETMNAEGESAAIVRALLGLGHGLGVVVTAEGIESAWQKDILTSQGCDDGQGFFFSKAMPAAELNTLFQRQRPWGDGPEHTSTLATRSSTPARG